MLWGRCCPRPAFAVLRARAASGIVHACLLHIVLGSGLHFGGLGRPWPSWLSDRDSGRCEYQSANAGISTHLWLVLDVPSELGCLPLRFGHARSISESVRPRRVVRIASSSPNPVGVGGLTPEDPPSVTSGEPRGHLSSHIKTKRPSVPRRPKPRCMPAHDDKPRLHAKFGAR